jgi:glycerol-3-phosphate acyltransferase PlsY
MAVEFSTASLLLGGLVGYFTGSIPFAYLFTRRATGKDLRVEGSRNIGTLNAFEVTGRRSVGAWVLIADLLKGLLPVFIFETLGYSDALVILIPALVLGHCYPVWLRFHGGRGLATAAGAVLLVSPVMVATWLLTYKLGRMVHDQVHFGAIVATGTCLGLLLLVPLTWLERASLDMSGFADHGFQMVLSIAVVLLIVLSRHIEPFLQLVRRKA